MSNRKRHNFFSIIDWADIGNKMLQRYISFIVFSRKIPSKCLEIRNKFASFVSHLLYKILHVTFVRI